MRQTWLGKRIYISGFLLLALTGALIFSACAAQSHESALPAATSAGTYTVVGIGPGDGDLLTLRARDAIEAADLVFCRADTLQKLAPYVNFSGKQVLDGYGVLFRYYGKDCSDVDPYPDARGLMSCEQYHEKQAEFAALVRTAVSAGKNVVMVSSGDPTLYGPDIWSLRELSDLKPTVIPGLSSFNAANAALELSLGEVILTAPFKKQGEKDTLEQLAVHDRATLVIFMPRNMKDLFSRLAATCALETPAAIVTHAGMKGREKITLGTVGRFNAAPPVVDSWNSIVYVGQSLENAQCSAVSDTSRGRGKYYLVGVGPGDPDLITIRGVKVLQSADLVFAHERIRDKFAPYLAGKKVLTGYHRIFPFYGKSCAEVTPAQKAREQMSCEAYHQKQAEFAALVRTAVAEGKTVAVLDSGDPLVYGPCSWSLTELRDLETEVVPGLSSFNAANAALKIGVTEGKTAHSVILASGWSVAEMAPHQSTLVLFTMRTEFKKFIDTLSAHYPKSTPVAIVLNAGYAEKEAVLDGTLETILDQTGADPLPFEYLLYVGDVLEARKE